MKIREILLSNKEYISSSFHVREIGIFGSALRGNKKKPNDIDILVEFEEGHRDFFNYVRLKYYLEDVFGRNVDLVMKKAIKKRLRNRILAEVQYV